MGLDGSGGTARRHEAGYGIAKPDFPLVYSICRKCHLRGGYFPSGFENL
jgi:hypothetical protein